MSGEGNTSRQSPRALSRELYEFCRSEFLSEDGLREIIEQHGVAPNNDPRVTNNNYAFFYWACQNERLTEGILRILLEYFPYAASDIDDANYDYSGYFGELPLQPLHCIFDNRNVALGMVQLLIDSSPDSLLHDRGGFTPISYLCYNAHDRVDEEVAVKILKLLIEKCPESVQHADEDGVLPIHYAAANRSLEFCRILIEEHPGSERMTNNDGVLPFHWACQPRSNIAKVKYLYQLHPESINVADNDGYYPINSAITLYNLQYTDLAAVTEVVQFLLDCDSNVALHRNEGKLPLYWVCKWATNKNTPKLNATLEILQTLYDAYPEAIESNEVTSDVGNFCEKVKAFINTQLDYARQARDHRVMTTQDENGQLPLHNALCDNASITLGSIKLLVKGNPSAVCTVDNRLRMPLHLACQHKSPIVVEYLIGLNKVTLGATDEEGNTVLHYACRGGNHDIIGLLLDKYGGSMSVSKRNALNQLPIHLLLESNDVNGRDDIKYVESVYRLMRAHPETIMNSI
jgi:ankyrin repeat protein